MLTEISESGTIAKRFEWKVILPNIKDNQNNFQRNKNFTFYPKLMIFQLFAYSDKPFHFHMSLKFFFKSLCRRYIDQLFLEIIADERQLQFSLTNFKFLGGYIEYFNAIRGMKIELTVQFYKTKQQKAIQLLQFYLKLVKNIFL